MSSVQTGQLISLLLNNVLMVMLVVILTVVAWLRWSWLRHALGHAPPRRARRRCRWSYISFMLAAVTLVGMVISLGLLALRSLVAVNALVTGAMGLFFLSVITLLLALMLWFVDLWHATPQVSAAVPQVNVAMLKDGRECGRPRGGTSVSPVPRALLSMSTSRRRLSKRSPRRRPSIATAKQSAY